MGMGTLRCKKRVYPLMHSRAECAVKNASSIQGSGKKSKTSAWTLQERVAPAPILCETFPGAENNATKDLAVPNLTTFESPEDPMASVLITGTSKGIGFETALAFAHAGHTVHATMRNPSQAPQLAQTAAKEKLPIVVSTMDVDSDQSVSQGIAQIHKDHGPIDVLVNNAGVERAGSIEELPFSDFRSVMETNYFGALRCIQAVVPQMRQRRSGCIVNLTSVAGRITCPPMAPYTASKWALEALSEALAGEMKTFNVRVLIVEPGIIDTAMARRLEDRPSTSPYRQRDRFASLFSESLKNPVPPSIVGKTILEIVESGTWQLRHPVGPDAVPFLEWRNHKTDEEWVDLNASDDEAWYASLQRDFGLDTRPKAARVKAS
jgi:NAD(P)-dependent dehydrogenase (short-subunit alcohol dehydrogenase family)